MLDFVNWCVLVTQTHFSSMKIVYIHQYFKTPEEGGAIRSYHIAKALVKAGHSVEMITSHNATETKKMQVEGISVTYLPIKYDQSFSFFRRVISFLQFLYATIKAIRKIDAIDLIYATSTPLTVGLIALFFKKTRSINYLFEVRDLWPEVPVKLGFITSKVLKKLLYKVEYTIYKSASTIITLSPYSYRYINKSGFESKTHLVPNMSDCEFFSPCEKQDETLFTIVYIGSFGIANNVNYLLEVAKKCEEQNIPVLFKLAGAGQTYQELKTTYSSLANCVFSPQLSKKAIRSLLNECDATYTSFVNHDVLESTSPNKFFDSLAAGKLTIVNTKGWLKELVERNECGFYHNPTSPDDFIEKITPFLNNTTKRQQFQMNARTLAESDFSVSKSTTKITQLVTSLGGNAIR